MEHRVTPSGNIFFQDYTGQLYHSNWSTIGDMIDLTTIIMQPYIWGGQPSGYVKNGILFRRGIVTVERQIIKLLSSGYEIVADGVSQYEDNIQMNYNGLNGPKDTFKYHLDHAVTEEAEGYVTIGPRWADIDDDNDIVAVWGDVDITGVDISTTGEEALKFIDVWSD